MWNWDDEMSIMSAPHKTVGRHLSAVEIRERERERKNKGISKFTLFCWCIFCEQVYFVDVCGRHCFLPGIFCKSTRRSCALSVCGSVALGSWTSILLFVLRGAVWLGVCLEYSRLCMVIKVVWRESGVCMALCFFLVRSTETMMTSTGIVVYPFASVSTSAAGLYDIMRCSFRWHCLAAGSFCCNHPQGATKCGVALCQVGAFAGFRPGAQPESG